MKALSAALLSSLALAVPAGAGAEIRHAAPAGDGPIASCPAADPCSLAAALDPDRLDAGDEVALASGDYVTGSFGISAAAWVHGASRAAPPRILINGFGFGVQLSHPMGRLSDVIIEQGDAYTGLYVRSGLAERIFVHAKAGGPACSVLEATLRDSVCWHESAPGVGAGFDGAYAGKAYLRNVTAVSTAEDGDASGIVLYGDQAELDAVNVIASGDDASAADVVAEGDGDPDPSAGLARVTLAASSFDTVSAGPGVAVTAPGSGSNQTAEPLFADAGAGDFRPQPGSPTIDAGLLDEISGKLDLAGAPRVMGAAPDIGAYEFPVPAEPEEPSGPGGPTGEAPADQPPLPLGPSLAESIVPDTRILRRPPKRTKVRAARFRFAERAGVAERFECRLDRGRFRPCASPLSLRVKPGRHTLRVRAVGPEGSDPTPAIATWVLVAAPSAPNRSD